MDEKTINSIMEDLTVVYETKTYFGIIEYTIKEYSFGKFVCVQFAIFNEQCAGVASEISHRYGCSWCVHPHLSKNCSIAIGIYDPNDLYDL